MMLEMGTISGNIQQDKLIGRFSKFALDCAELTRSLPKTEENRIYGRQLLRSSSSMGANYAEATTAASRKDFANDANKSRKESRESLYWLGLLKRVNPSKNYEIEKLAKECEELARILTSIVKKSRGL